MVSEHKGYEAPIFMIQAILSQNGFNLKMPIQREEDFFGRRILFTQDD